MLGLARSYFSRSPDEWEKKGFPVIETSKDDLGDFSENVIWVGHATLLLNYDCDGADRPAVFRPRLTVSVCRAETGDTGAVFNHRFAGN